jgi:hypothetical protein
MMNNVVNIFGYKIDITLFTSLISVLGGLIGVLVGGYITSKSNIRHMTKSTKRDLEIKSTDEMLREINILGTTLSDAVNSLMFFTLNLHTYNETVIVYLDGCKNSQLDSNIMQYREYRVKLDTDNLIKIIENHRLKWELYSSSFNSYWNTYESNEVILHKFREIYNFILNESRKLVRYQNNLVSDIYFMNISSDTFMKKLLSEEVIQKAEEEWNKLQQQYWDFLVYLQDFRIELQNYYYSKLFNKYKIPKRKPKDESLIVLSLDTDFSKIKNSD